MRLAFAIFYYSLPLALAWCVISFLKVYPRPGHLRKFLYRRFTRDDRPFLYKCNRFRIDGPTPCYCCEGRCYAAKDGEA